MFGDTPPAVVVILFTFGLVVLALVMQGMIWFLRSGVSAALMDAIARCILSIQQGVARRVENGGSRRSHAVEQVRELAGTDLVAVLEQLSDDDLLDVLARVRGGEGAGEVDWRWADSRIAKFVGGRTEDRTAQVREVRGKDAPPPKPVRMLAIRGASGVQQVPMES